MTIYITTSGYNNPGTFRIKYVIATASGDNVQVTLTDASGVPFYQAECTTSGERFFPAYLGGHQVTGIKTATWANVESVILGVENVNTN